MTIAAAGLAASGIGGLVSGLADQIQALDAKVHATALANPVAGAGGVNVNLAPPKV